MSSDSKSIELLGAILTQLKTNNRNNPSLSIDSGGLNAKTINQLTNAIGAMSNAASSTQNAAEMAVGTVEHAKNTLAEFGPVMGTAMLAVQQLDKATGGLAGKIAKMTGFSKIFSSALGPVINISKNFVRWKDDMTNTNSALTKMYSTLSLVTGVTGQIAGAFVSIGTSVVKLGASLAKNVLSALGSVFSMMTKIATFTVTLPIDIANKAADIGNKLRQEIVEVIGQAAQNAKQFMDTATNGGEAIVNLGRIAKGSLLTFQSVNSTMTKLFGYGAAGAANMINELSKGINDMGVFADVFASSTTKSGKSIEFFTRMTRGMGMGADDIKYVMLEAMKNGEHYYDVMTRFKEASDTVSAEFGVNRKRLSGNFLQLRKDIVNFGHLSDIELHRVAGAATQLGVEMKDVSGVFNKFGTFEDAANSAALLSQTFGMNIDALQLIKAENPMEIVKMFRSAMQATGRSFDDLNRHEKALMAQYTGMSSEALKSIMNYRNAGKSYEEIKKIMKDQKPEERQIRAMKDMNTQMSEIQKIMEKKDFFSAFFDGVTKTIIYQGKMGGVLYKISQTMENFYESGLRFDKGQRKQLDNILEPFTDILDGIHGVFSKQNLKKLKQDMLNGLEGIVNEINNANISSKMPSYKTNNTFQNKIYNMFTLQGMLNNSGFIGDLARQTGKLVHLMMKSFIVAGPEIAMGIGDAIIGALTFLTTGTISEKSNDAFAKFLGLKKGSKAYINLKTRFAERLNDLKEYVFGKDGDYKQGFVYRLIHGTTGAARNVNQEFKASIGQTGGIFHEMFKSIGKSVVSGMREAKDALIEIGESIAIGVGKAFGFDMQKTGVLEQTVGKGEGASRVIQQYRRGGVISGSIASVQEINTKVDKLLEVSEDDGFLSGGLKYTGQIAKSPLDLLGYLVGLTGKSGGGGARLKGPRLTKGSSVPDQTNLIKDIEDLYNTGGSSYAGGFTPGVLAQLTGQGFQNMGRTIDTSLARNLVRSAPGGTSYRAPVGPSRSLQNANRITNFLTRTPTTPSSGGTMMKSLKTGGKFLLKRVPVLTLLAEAAKYSNNVDEAAEILKGLKDRGIKITPEDEQRFMAQSRKSEIARRGVETAGGLATTGFGAAAGAKAGAFMGSFAGPIGTVVGGLLGGLVGGGMGYFAGSSLAGSAAEGLGLKTAQGEMLNQLRASHKLDKSFSSDDALFDTRGLGADYDKSDADTLKEIAALKGTPSNISYSDIEYLAQERAKAIASGNTDDVEKYNTLLSTLREYIEKMSNDKQVLQLQMDSTTFASIMINKLGQMQKNPSLGGESLYTVELSGGRANLEK